MIRIKIRVRRRPCGPVREDSKDLRHHADRRAHDEAAQRSAELVAVELQALGVEARGELGCVSLELAAARRLIERLRDLRAKERDLQRFEERGHL